MQLFILVFIVLLFVPYIILLMYYRLGWKSIPMAEPADVTHPVSMSVVIAARNEEVNLPILLESLKKQTYSKDFFEVIVVDDHSTDTTASIVERYASGNIRLIRLQDHALPAGTNSYKKKAIETAIAAATGELIVTTDADCVVPASWLQTIASFYEKFHPSFIVMPVCYHNRNNFLEIFQSLDFMTLQGITGAAVSRGLHSMCNGANLAYTKNAFIRSGGFEGIDAIASGDDMLLMHKIYKQDPAGIRYLKSADVIVQTGAMHSWKEFINQRIRWASKADNYDDKRIFWVLLCVYLVNVMLLVLPVAATIKNSTIHIAGFHGTLFETWLLLLLLKTLVELYFLLPVARFFKKVSLLTWFPFSQPVHIVYTIVAGWLGKFGNYEWKERKVK